MRKSLTSIVDVVDHTIYRHSSYHKEDKLSLCYELPQLAVTALCQEAAISPKPGLVDRQNSGAHHDMNYSTMITSALNLHESFSRAVDIVVQDPPAKVLAQELVKIGIAAEARMFLVTGGINTHRGAIWSLGILTAAVAQLIICQNDFSHNQVFFNKDNISRKFLWELELRGKIYSSFPPQNTADSKIVSGGIDTTQLWERAADFSQNLVQQRLYSQESTVEIPSNPVTDHNLNDDISGFGRIIGATAEACAGFPHVANYSLPILLTAKKQGLDDNVAALLALLALLAHVTDTCVIHRGGITALQFMRARVASLGAIHYCDTRSFTTALGDLDTEFIARNISPGGCADLLAVTLFVESLINRGILHYPPQLILAGNSRITPIMSMVQEMRCAP